MKITKSQLKQIIKEELESVVQEQKDPEKLEAAAKAMALFTSGVHMGLSVVQGGGRPPEVLVEGVDIYDWFSNKSGFSKDEIAAAARKKKVTVQ